MAPQHRSTAGSEGRLITWFRVDDNLAFHPKALIAGNAALGLWVRAGSWAAQQLTDGYVPTEIATALGTPAQTKALLDAGLWVPCGAGYEFHEWEERQPTRSDVRAAREQMGRGAQQSNHARWHVARGLISPTCKWCTLGDPP